MEQVIDVLQTVKLLRIKRPGIVENLVSCLSYNCSYADTYYIHMFTITHHILSFPHPGSIPVHIYCCGTFSTIL